MSDQEMEVAEKDEDETMEEAASQSDERQEEVYLPGRPLEDGEELVCDQTAYTMLHQAQTGAPCLSFDVIKDSLGDSRETYPLTAFIVSGTQSSKVQSNNIIVMKLSNLHKTNSEDDEDDDDNDEESDDERVSKDPKMAGALIKHQGCVNRIRSTILNNKVIAASWSELGRVNLWDLSAQLEAVDNDHLLSKYNKENRANLARPIYSFSGHQMEGFAMDWCHTIPGKFIKLANPKGVIKSENGKVTLTPKELDQKIEFQTATLATGDCKKNIHIWQPIDGGSWQVDQRPLIGHTDSVEDLQWSPTERNVLASCSVDKSIRIWDTRAQPSKACMLTTEDAHSSDVNVISWNKNEPFIVSGGDDGVLNIWDLRRFTEKTPVATFKHHTEPITTVEWHPTDSAVFASGGDDNQIVLWDLSVEKDSLESSDEVEGIPPQLLFIHQGQTEVKELHWHPQLPGVIISTALSGFNIFRTISV